MSLSDQEIRDLEVGKERAGEVLGVDDRGWEVFVNDAGYKVRREVKGRTGQ